MSIRCWFCREMQPLKSHLAKNFLKCSEWHCICLLPHQPEYIVVGKYRNVYVVPITLLLQILWSKEFAKAVFSDQNLEDKTPLQLAVENGHVKWEYTDVSKVNYCQSFSSSTMYPAFWGHSKLVLTEEGRPYHHNGTVSWKQTGGIKWSLIFSTLAHVAHWMLSNISLTAGGNLTSGIYWLAYCTHIYVFKFVGLVLVETHPAQWVTLFID